MTYNELVLVVANEFAKTCKEGGFDTFAEMVKCYRMSGDDVKHEIVSMVCETGEAWMDEDSGDIMIGTSIETYTYKCFIRVVKKEIQNALRGI